MKVAGLSSHTVWRSRPWRSRRTACCPRSIAHRLFPPGPQRNETRHCAGSGRVRSGVAQTDDQSQSCHGSFQWCLPGAGTVAILGSRFFVSRVGLAGLGGDDGLVVVLAQRQGRDFHALRQLDVGQVHHVTRPSARPGRLRSTPAGPSAGR
jgi:hypothetical protein